MYRPLPFLRKPAHSVALGELLGPMHYQGALPVRRRGQRYSRGPSGLLLRLLARLWNFLAHLPQHVLRLLGALRLKPLAAAMATVLTTALVGASLPGGTAQAAGPVAAVQTISGNVQGTPKVVSGTVDFNQAGKTLTVTNTPSAIIEWNKLGTARDELLRFVQQNAQSQVLNRVTGVDPSVFLGQLQSNGRVFIINPNGVVFGAGSQVDVAGLVASSLSLSNSDFLNGKLKFGDANGGSASSAGAVKNEGNIRTAVGGEVLLVAPRVENSGLIFAPEGKILLAASKLLPRMTSIENFDKCKIDPYPWLSG